VNFSQTHLEEEIMNEKKHNQSPTRLRWLIAATTLLVALDANAAAQSTDIDSPTPMTTNIITGKSNGKAKTIYYSFTATAVDPGEVKVKVTASTDERSTNLRVNFLDDDGQKVMDEIYVIPNRDPAVKVGKHTFADRQKVIVRITLPDDPQVKLLNYKIEVTGAVEFEPTPDATTTTEPAATPTPDPGATAADSDPTVQSGNPSQSSADQADQQSSGDATTGTQTESKKNVKQKVKETVKKKSKEAVKDLLKDNQF
jgi:hypothetical protein